MVTGPTINVSMHLDPNVKVSVGVAADDSCAWATIGRVGESRAVFMVQGTVGADADLDAIADILHRLTAELNAVIYARLPRKWAAEPPVGSGAHAPLTPSCPVPGCHITSPHHSHPEDRERGSSLVASDREAFDTVAEVEAHEARLKRNTAAYVAARHTDHASQCGCLDAATVCCNPSCPCHTEVSA